MVADPRSLLYLGAHLDRPNLETVRAAELAAIDEELEEALARLEIERSARLASDQERRDREYADARRDHQDHVKELEALLRAEMDNVINGIFRGPRYDTFEQRLKEARKSRDAALTALAIRHREEAVQLAAELDREQRKARAELKNRAEERRLALRNGALDRDERAHDPRIVALMQITESVLGWQMTAPQFVFVFALFLSVVIELGIVLAFDTITLSALPALTVQHREEVTTEAMAAEMRGSSEREALRHREAMDRVRRTANRVVERAEAASTSSDWHRSGVNDEPSRCEAA